MKIFYLRKNSAVCFNNIVTLSGGQIGAMGFAISEIQPPTFDGGIVPVSV
jgi:hypothetical protein